MKISKHRVGLVLLGVWLTAMIYLLASSHSSLHTRHRENFELQQDATGNHSQHHSQHHEVETSITVHVCMTSDENTVIGMVAAINSIRLNSRHHVCFHLVTNDKTAEHLRRWIQSTDLKDIDYEIKVFDTKAIENKILVRGGRQELAKPMNYARFYYSELFPDLHGKVLHIDDDCIVQGDIMALHHTKLEDSHIAAFSPDCSAVGKRFNSQQNTYSHYIDFDNLKIKALKMKPLSCSFNTGVYVVDLDKWRKENITQQLEHWMELNTREPVYGNERGGGGSQPPLMIVLYKRWAKIEPMWHVRQLGWTAAQRYSPHFIQHAKLLHWNGKFKPWMGVAQYKDIWDQYFIPDPAGVYVPVRKIKKKH